MLLVLAVIALIGGVTGSGKENRTKRHDPADIRVRLTAKTAEYHPNESGYINGCYYIYFDFKLTNRTDATLDYVEIQTTVCDKDGKELGTLHSSFGAIRQFEKQSGLLELAPGKSAEKQTYLKENQPEGFFVTVYNTPYEELNFSCKVLSASFSDGYSYSAP